MRYTFYILFSETTNKYYSGHTNKFERRIVEHNTGQNKSTKSGIPWEVVYQKHFQTRAEAAAMEAKLKRMKSKKYIKWFIQSEGT
jgi:putative endonuclease